MREPNLKQQLQNKEKLDRLLHCGKPANLVISAIA